jgi:hypothetical protein
MRPSPRQQGGWLMPGDLPPAVADGRNPQHNILHHEVFVSLEARTRWNCRRKDHLLNADTWRHRAADVSPATLVPRLRRGARFHTARLDIGATLQALQSRNLLAQLRDSTLLFRVLAQQLQNQPLQIGIRQTRHLGLLLKT